MTEPREIPVEDAVLEAIGEIAKGLNDEEIAAMAALRAEELAADYEAWAKGLPEREAIRLKADAARNAEINKLKALLAKAGVKLSIGGCGCCGSPWVKAEYQSETIIDGENVNFDMFKD